MKLALLELPQAGALSKYTLSNTRLLSKFVALTPLSTLFQLVVPGYLAPERLTAWMSTN